jgi:hypothetical protein
LSNHYPPNHSHEDEYCEKQWALSTRSLENEFDILAPRIQMIEEVKNLFFDFVRVHQFTSQACIALYYRLFLFSTLVLMQVIESKGVTVAEVYLSDLTPVWRSSKKWSNLASDSDLLEKVLGNINYSLELLMHDLGNRA